MQIQSNSLNLLSSLPPHEVPKLTYFSELPSKNLSELLPDEQQFTKKALGEYNLLLTALFRLIECIEANELDKLDALVSENLCQIRALIIPLSLDDCKASLLSKKEHVKSTLETVKKLIEITSDKDTKHFNFLLQSNHLEISLTGIEAMFVELYILTLVKSDKEEGKTCIPNLSTIIIEKSHKSLVNRVFSDKLVKKFRTEVSELSAPFLIKLADVCQDKDSLEMLSEKNIIEIYNRKSLPMYWTMKVIFQATFLYGIPVIIWVREKSEKGKLIKEFCNYYEKDSSGPHYRKLLPLCNEENKEKPAIVVEAVRIRDGKNKKEISILDIEQMNLLHFLLAHAASHPQYADKTIDVKTSDKSYHYYVKKAFKWKCIKDDPSIPHIHHIYSNVLGKMPIKYDIDSYLEHTYGDFFRNGGHENKIYDWRRFNPIALAKAYGKPIKFLIDHKSRWEDLSYETFKKIVKFISENSKNFMEPEVLDMLLDWLNLGEILNSDCLSLIYECASKALSIPECQERVSDFFIDAGRARKAEEGVPNMYEISRRSIAREKLKAVNVDVTREALQDMLASEELIPLQIDLLTTLEGINYSSESTKSLLASMKIDCLSKDKQLIDIKKILTKILELIASEKNDKQLRKVALRSLTNLFFHFHQEFPIQELRQLNTSCFNYSRDISRQQITRIIIYRFLKHFIQNSTDIDIRNEASSIFKLITTQLQKIDENYQPYFEDWTELSWSKTGVYPSDSEWARVVLKKLIGKKHIFNS